jgi:hypothetical protein
MADTTEGCYGCGEPVPADDEEREGWQVRGPGVPFTLCDLCVDLPRGELAALRVERLGGDR